MLDDPATAAPDEARVIPLGQPIEGGITLFKVTLLQAREYVVEMPDADRGGIAIWTPGHVFSADELLAEPEGLEHEPLPPEDINDEGFY